MTQKSPYPLNQMLKELQLNTLVHLEMNEGLMGNAGDESLGNALTSSNLLVVLQSDMPPMPIRLSNNEIYEMILRNDRGIVAKEGRANRYMIALRMDTSNVLAAIGDDLDPGIILFELLQYYKKSAAKHFG
ncbi:MAG: hypothetical protein JSW11_12510 [Candidatus Heimdallarchaeota archaeon]|nr:MAG: hypothetical protein JSW11_12510 [Candidatus Heimdallarchaeota archaeon]